MNSKTGKNSVPQNLNKEYSLGQSRTYSLFCLITSETNFIKKNTLPKHFIDFKYYYSAISQNEYIKLKKVNKHIEIRKKYQK